MSLTKYKRKSKKVSRDRKKATFPVPLTKLPPLSIIIPKRKREENHYKKSRQKTRQNPWKNQPGIYISGAYCRTDDSCDSCCSSDPGSDRLYQKIKRKSYHNGSHLAALPLSLMTKRYPALAGLPTLPWMPYSRIQTIRLKSIPPAEGSPARYWIILIVRKNPMHVICSPLRPGRIHGTRPAMPS